MITIRKSGGADIVSIPKAYMRQLGLVAGDKFDSELVDGKLILTPVYQKKTLESILSGFPIERDAEDEEWLNDKPVGREEI